MHPGAHKDCTTDAIVHGVAWVTFALFLLGAAALLVLWSFMDESRTEPFVGCFFVCSIAAMTYFCKASGYGEIKINGTARPRTHRATAAPNTCACACSCACT